MRVKLSDLEACETIDRFVALDAAGKIVASLNPTLRRVIDWYRWIACGGCIIRDVNQRLIPLRPNRTQRLIIATMLLQAAAKRPIRLVVFKARKVGVSTLVDSWGQFLAEHYPHQICGLMAHIASSTTEIFDIAKIMHDHWTAVRYGIKQKRCLIYQDSRFWAHTAGGKNLGAGGTPSFLHLSEFALWSRNARETEAAAINALPFVPSTTLIIESSPRGRNRFWDYYAAACTAENAYDAIFIPWYFDESLTAAVNLETFSLRDDEREVRAKAAADGIELSPETLMWRRLKIDEIGPGLFRQEFPSTPEEALQAFSGRVLPDLRALPWSGIAGEPNAGGIDFGFNDPTAIVQSIEHDQCVHVLRVWNQRCSLAATQAKRLARGARYWYDPSGLQAAEELRAASIAAGIDCQLIPAPRVRQAGVNTTNSEWELIRTMASEGRLFINHHACEQLLIEADSLLYNENTGMPDDRRSDAVGHFDSVQALKYLSMGISKMLEPMDRPTPPVVRRRTSIRQAW